MLICKKNFLKIIRNLSLLTVACLSSTAMAFAQNGDNIDDQDADIVVDGKRTKPTEHIPQLFDNNGGQLARFESDFCPSVSGLPEQYSVAVLKMVRENAVALGLTLLEENCEANAIIIFAQNAPEYMAGLRKKKGEWFNSLTARNKRLLTSRMRSYYAWHIISTNRVTGGSNFDLDNQNNVTASALGARGGTPNATEGQFGNPNSDGGRLETPVEEQISIGFVVVDLLKADGMSLRQIADFATLHLIMDIDVDHQKTFPSNSILNLFDIGDPSLLPAQMTDVDRLTARGLYAIRRNNKEAWKQSRVVANFVRDNINEDTGADEDKISEKDDDGD